MLRRYQKKDIEAIVSIELEVLHSTLEASYYEADLKNPLARHYVLDGQNGVIGFISTVYDGAHLEILNLGIRKAYQHQGYGSMLLAGVMDELLIEGLESVILEVRASNHSAQSFYERFGFKKIGTRTGYYSNHEDAYLYQKLFSLKCDMANVEAILFSKKKGFRFYSDFQERYCLNYYDFYDTKQIKLEEIQEERFIQIKTNWYDEALFQNFQKTEYGLFHLHLCCYHSLNSNSIEVGPILNWEEFANRILEKNEVYGRKYAEKYAAFIQSSLFRKHSYILGAYQQQNLVGWMILLFFEQSIFILEVYTLEPKRHQGVASALFDGAVAYAKAHQYWDFYLEALLDDTPQLMYQRMNFKKIEKLYVMFQEQPWKKQM